MAGDGGAMADIFISYAREDRETAERLAAALGQQGWSVWWDPDIHPGETWDEVIERELDAARCVTVLWSERSIGKEWVRVEATEGLERRILVPALIEDVKPPLRFRHVQAAPLVDWNGEQGHRGFERLLKALSAKLGALPRHKPQSQGKRPLNRLPNPSRSRNRPSRRRPRPRRNPPRLGIFPTFQCSGTSTSRGVRRWLCCRRAPS